MSSLMNSEMAEFLKEYRIEPRETTPEIEELRKIRDEYYNKSQEIQKQIDQKFLELHDIPKFLNQWIYSKTKGATTVGLVKKIERLFYGFRVQFEHGFQETNGQLCVIKELEITLSWEEGEKYTKILSSEEAIKIITDTFNKVINKYNNG